jgi:dCMP deaminase
MPVLWPTTTWPLCFSDELRELCIDLFFLLHKLLDPCQPGSQHVARLSLLVPVQCRGTCEETRLSSEHDTQPMPSGARMRAAFRVSVQSPNRVRQVGAVLVLRDGTEIAACNTFPAGVRDLDERHAGDGRFVWMEHAERHAIFEAARRGLATAGGHITSTFFPCIDCARAIVEAGIVCLDTPAPAFDDPVWGASFERSEIILQEGGVAIRIVDVEADRPV